MATGSVTTALASSLVQHGSDSVSRLIARRRLADRGVGLVLFAAAFSSIAITAGIVGILLYESATFFAHVSLWEFFTDTLWSPTFASPRFGILPLVAGTLVTTAVALFVALPIGTIVAMYLSEYVRP